MKTKTFYILTEVCLNTPDNMSEEEASKAAIKFISTSHSVYNGAEFQSLTTVCITNEKGEKI